MSVATFIPEIWNAALWLEFREEAVAATVSNRTYEGNAAVGNTVVINQAIDVNIKDYAYNDRTTSPDAVTTDDQKLLIDQEKNFDFLVDDIDRRQAAGSMDAFTQSAGLGLAEDADKFILSTAEAGALAANQLGGTEPSDGDGAFDVFRDLRKALNKEKVPRGQRVAFVNAEFGSLLVSASSKLTSADTSGDTRGLRDAFIGRILGFDVYESENLPEVDEMQVVSFYQPAVAFVSQITDQTEALRDIDSFSDRLRGLHVYGARVIRPNGVATYNPGS